MKIYLDIDGVLLNKDKSVPNGAVDFLKEVTSKYEVFWLTTHCKGDAHTAIIYLKAHYPTHAHPYIEMIQPTNWDVLKTDAITFNEDFLWFDDTVFESEKVVLEKNNALNKQVLVDLRENPNFFESYRIE
ncbi:hypothetical protein GW764_04065 [Candidatus Parcubacteria bacterium]|nr:hypothetical protein [Candidatus Parcubacteria bacterium]